MAKVTLGYPKTLTKRYTRLPSLAGKPFRFRVHRAIIDVLPADLRRPDPASPQIGEVRVIQGSIVRSESEWWLYQALLALGVADAQIDYQVYYGGGRNLGGQVIDFVLNMGGAPIALRPMGGYWHPSEYGTIEDVWGYHQLTNAGYVVMDFPSSDVDTFEKAIAWVKRNNLA